MPKSNLEIAKELNRARQRLDELWLSTKSKKKRAEIDSQMDAIDKEVMRLISIQIKDKGAAYDAAVSSLRSANRVLKKALDDIENFVKAMEAVAKAIAFVVKVAEK